MQWEQNQQPLQLVIPAERARGKQRAPECPGLILPLFFVHVKSAGCQAFFVNLPCGFTAFWISPFNRVKTAQT